jgi:glycine cleavage system H protein
MVLIFVLVTFGVFIAIDYLRNRNKEPQIAMEMEEGLVAVAPMQLEAVVEGFHVPERLRFHAGHGWALRERTRLARVGVDEFGAALLGGVDRIELPKPGHWVRQGQKAWGFYRNGEKAEMVSPVEGEVVEVNPDVLKDPSLLRKDPYGRGWLMAVHVPDEESVLRNLLPIHLVKDWIRENAERLFAMQPQLAGPVMADGGRPIESLTAGLPGSSWKELTEEFFLSA